MGDEWEELRRRERELYGPHPKKIMSLRELADSVLEGPFSRFPILTKADSEPALGKHASKNLRRWWRLPR
jgi:hypothetical protein